MPVLIVHDEPTLADLRHRLVGRRGPDELPDPVVEAIRRANPHVDLDDLRPGIVLTIPDLADVRAAEGAPDELLTEGLKALVTALGEVVATSGEEAEQQARAEAANRATVRRSLDLRAVQEAARGDQDLQDELARVKERLAKADEQADQTTAERRRALATWREDLDAVSQLGL